MAEESCYMVMASNASRDVNPANTLTQFTNELPQGMNVEGCKIALQSLYLDNKFGNIPNAILGTKDHFILFFNAVDTSLSVPEISRCTITDLFLSRTQFIRAVKDQLLNENVLAETPSASDKLHFWPDPDGGQKILFRLRNAILLVHPEMNAWLNFTSDPPIMYKGLPYFKLVSSAHNGTYASRGAYPAAIIQPAFIKVQLEQMCQTVSAVKLLQSLAVIKPLVGEYPLNVVPKRKEYFDFNCARLDTLSVRLVDENDWPLQPGNGQPTFLKLKVKRFPMKSHVLRLSSRESDDVFEDNTNRKFQVQLQEPLVWGNWEVALSSVVLPTKTNLKMMLAPSNFFIEVNGRRMTLNGLTDFTSNGLVRHMMAKLANTFAPADGEDAIASAPLSFYVEGGNIMIHAGTYPVELNVSGLFAYAVFSVKGKATSHNPTAVVRVNVEPQLRTVFGRFDVTRLHPHLIFLHCNFIRPIVIGSTFGQLLQMIPYTNGNDDAMEGPIMKYEADHLDFTPLSMNDPSTLQFEMRNAGGDFIYFADDRQAILLTLVFREKTSK